MRRYKYIRKDRILEFVRKNPGAEEKIISNFFGSRIVTSLYKLESEGKLIRVRQGHFKWYEVRKEPSQFV